MNWYNIFSSFYDLSIEKLYKKHRQEAFEFIDKDQVTNVLDFACGTGQNFPFLTHQLGEDKSIIGLDYSEGMLAKAKNRISKNDWQNVSLLQADARSLNQQQIDDHKGKSTQIDCIISTLALVVVPDWEEIFANLFELLEPGGQFLMMEVWAEKWVPQTTWTEILARADLKRKVWEPLEKASEHFEFKYLKSSPHIHGGRLFVATGFKPE